MSERKAAFEEYCKEAGASKAKGKGAAAGGGFKPGRASAAAAAAPVGGKDAAAQFEALLDEAERASSGSGTWGPDLMLAQLEGRWGSDPRWQHASAAQRAAALDQRVAALRAAARKQAEAEYRALLREHGVTASSRWSRTKDDLSADPRYLALDRDDRHVLCCAVHGPSTPHRACSTRPPTHSPHPHLHMQGGPVSGLRG